MRRTDRARGHRLLAGAALVLALTLALGAASAGGAAPLDRVTEALDPGDLGGELGEGGGSGEPAGCPRRLRELGVCGDEGERPGHGDDHAHDDDGGGDFEPFAGEADRGQRGADRRRSGRARRSAHRDAHREGRRHAHGRTRGRTTLEQTIEGTGDPEEGYQDLRIGPGEPRVVREELAKARPGRAGRRVSLLYAGQTTDWQLVDEESPARVEMVDITANPPFPSALNAAWRPQEALGAFAVDGSIRQLNRFAGRSPVAAGDGARAAMEMVLMTGDQADNQQLNETEWVLRLLEGGSIDPNSGTDPSACPPGQQPSGQTADPALYAGVQDSDDYAEGLQFYDPDQPSGPKYADWPAYPGLMDRAQRPFEAAGLEVPTYVVFGNHDGLAQGNEKALLPFELVGVGCIKPLVPAADLTELGDVLDPEYLAGLLASDPSQVMLVPPDPRRRYVDKRQFKQVFLDGAQADGYGFGLVDAAEVEASDGAASYYAWTPKPGLRMIGIDTLCEGGVVGPAASGNVDDPQFRWLETELERAGERDQLVVVFGHHPMRSLTCSVPDETPPPCTAEGQFGHDLNAGCDIDPRSSEPLHDGADLTALLHRHPHVIAYVAGHTHENTLSEFKPPDGGPGEFWGIETASLIDWPPQNRLIEVMDNCDGTLSIFGTTLDGAAPATAPGSGTEADGLGTDDLGSISRTIAFNDPQAGAGTGEGEPADRNVELLIDDPRRDPSSCKAAAEQPAPGGGGGGGGGAGGGSGGGAPSPTAASGSLPFTGLLVGALLAIGLALAALGGLGRRLARGAAGEALGR